MIRINEQIKSAQVRVIDETGGNIGVLTIEQALAMAREKKLDLVEISPNAQPPVVKIISFDKYRYQEEKKAKKLRAQQKIQEFKQVQISARAAQHDMEVKAKKVNEFLGEGHKVEIMLRLRGREKANKDWAKQKLVEFLKIILPEHKVLMDIRYTGRGFATQVVKK